MTRSAVGSERPLVALDVPNNRLPGTDLGVVRFVEDCGAGVERGTTQRIGTVSDEITPEDSGDEGERRRGDDIPRWCRALGHYREATATPRDEPPTRCQPPLPGRTRIR